MKAFYINLDRRKDRREQFEQACRQAHIEVERFPAVDGLSIDLPSSRGSEEQGVYAALLSHKAVIERARELQLPEVMVFEDDAVFPHWFQEEVDYFMSQVPNDWAMLYFGGHGWPRHWQHIRGPVLRCWDVCNTECYVVRNTAYDAMIATLNRSAPITNLWGDVALLDLQVELPTYTMLNPIVRQTVTYSDTLMSSGNLNHSRCTIPGRFTDLEGEEYLRQVRRFEQPTVAHLGIHKGRPVSFIAGTIHRRRGVLFSIGLWDRKPSQWSEFERWTNAAGLRRYLSTIVRDTIEAAPLFADGSFDIVFHDAKHWYRGLTKEIRAWLPKVRSGGVIMGHDYTDRHRSAPDVKRAVDELFGSPSRVVDSLWVRDV